MTVKEWFNSASDDIKRWMQGVMFLNFLHAERNRLFQMQGMYDGAMSDACKQLFRKDYKAVGDLLNALAKDAGMIECDECGAKYEPMTDSYKCPVCGAENYPEDEE